MYVPLRSQGPLQSKPKYRRQEGLLEDGLPGIHRANWAFYRLIPIVLFLLLSFHCFSEDSPLHNPETHAFALHKPKGDHLLFSFDTFALLAWELLPSLYWAPKKLLAGQENPRLWYTSKQASEENAQQVPAHSLSEIPTPLGWKAHMPSSRRLGR